MTGARAIAIVSVAMIMSACAPRFQEPGPAIAEPKIADDAIVMADGGRLPLRAWLPKDGAPKAVVVASLFERALAEKDHRLRAVE